MYIIPIRWPTPTSSEVQTVQDWNLQGKTPTNVTVESLPSRYGTDHSAGLDRTAVKMTRLSLFSAVRATWIYLNAFLPFMGSIVWFLVWAIGVLRSTRSNGWAGFWTTRWRYSMIFRDAWKSSMPMPGQSDLPTDGNLCFVTVWGRVDICTMMSIDVNCICGQSPGESLARSLPPRCGACAAKTMRHWPWCRDRGPHHRRGRCSLEGWKEVEAGCLAHLSTAWGTKAWDGHEKLVLLVASARCVTLRAGWLQRLWWTISLRPRLLALEINCRVDDAHTHRHYIDIRITIETYTRMLSVNMWRAQHLRWCA